ncbi:MAG: asparagine synthase (glutamine-hydrolyzing) [Gammaproteobacteria bacterium]|nr:asparagine synthase (glutamine-hydrolyzing) [Gammaproteobacteria bacterium]
MCGIAGWFSAAPISADAETSLRSMIRTLIHRGPDGEGIKLFDHAALGHCRLAIIDPNGGQQPMHSHDGRYCIIFNGEIYNYQALRKTLAERGHTFQHHSDTEVILELYRADGWQGFSRLRGMFSFALWDNQLKQGFLVRDPQGIKPLFIQHQGGQLYFASEAKALPACQPQKSQLDHNALHQLMNFRYLPGSISLFKGVSQLPPATVLSWQPSGVLQQHLIQPTATTTGDTLSQLRNSVEQHLTADVEVACYLSGGIDSATIAAIAVQQQPLRSFTLAVGDDPNEAINAASSAQLLNIQNQQGEIGGDLEQQLLSLVWHLETPKVNALQVSQLAQLASKEVKVVLSGLGGDELFFGYNAHKIFNQCQHLSRWLPRLASQPLGALGNQLISTLQRTPWSEPQRAMQMLQQLGNWPQLYGLLRNVWDNPKMRRQIYGPRMLDQPLDNSFELLERRWPKTASPIASMAQFELHNKMVNDLLWQEDRVSMAVGVEVRTPFVDAPLIAHMQQFRPEQLMSGGAKGYLRQVIKELLPAEILQRPKSGFQLDSPHFFHQQLKPIAERWLNQEITERHGLFNYTFIDWVQKHPPRTGLRWHYFMLYLMLLTHMWMMQFEGKDAS